MDGFDQNHIYQLWLHYGTEHFPNRFREVTIRYPSLEEAFLLAKKRSGAAFDFVPERVKARLFEAAGDGFMQRYAGWLIKNGIGVSLLSDEDYPSLLREIHDAPPLLFYKGKLEKEPPLPLAMIGARRSTRYGRDIARLFACELAGAGATIVSGLAAGVDAASSEGALQCEESLYPTLAVLGCGIDVVYPKENAALYERITARGAIVTEFLPKTPPARENFPIRNRVISGMSRGVIVVEAGERSGTSITVGYALDQGRDVFAIPGRITDIMSVGTNRLIQRGEAKAVFCSADILSEYDFTVEVDSFTQGAKCIRLSTLGACEQAIVRALLTGEKTIDELCTLIPLPAGEINSCLTGMEFSGIMKQSPGRLYELDALNVRITQD